MTRSEIIHARLYNQHLGRSELQKPLDIVRRLGAMQAQDYLAARWAIGVRLPDSTEASIEQAVANMEIIRTWPMRGTLHFVPPEDAKWMLKLMAPRIMAGSSRRHEQLELDDATFAKSFRLIERELQGKRLKSRAELLAMLEAAGIAAAGGRGYHILKLAALQARIFVGPLKGKQQTFGLLDEWVPQSVELPRDQALATIAERYFTSHGPATLKDFIWWTGLTVADAKRAVEIIASELAQTTIEGQVFWFPADLPSLKPVPSLYLLPPFDEYLVGYTDRSAALEALHAPKVVVSSNGMFFPIVVVDGQIVGTWRRALQKERVAITSELFDTGVPTESLRQAAQRYATFVGKELVMANSR